MMFPMYFHMEFEFKQPILHFVVKIQMLNFCGKTLKWSFLVLFGSFRTVFVLSDIGNILDQTLEFPIRVYCIIDVGLSSE